MANNGKAFELLTRNVFEELAKLEGLNLLEIKHDCKLRGLSGAEHQIDVYLKYEVLGQEHESIIEAKDFSSPVDKPRLMSFFGVLSDLPRRPNGIFVTRSGFDEGNIPIIAASYNIGLYVLENFPQSVAFTVRLFQNSIWLSNIVTDTALEAELFHYLKTTDPETWLLFDDTGNPKSSIQELMNKGYDLMVANNVPPGGFLSVDLEKDKVFFQAGGKKVEKIPVYGIVFERKRTLEGEQDVSTRLTHLLNLLTGQRKYFVDDEGKVYRENEDQIFPVEFKSVGMNKEDISINVMARIKDQPAKNSENSQ